MVQVEKERTEYKKRVDRMEEEADTLKTETTMLKRDLEEVKIVTAHYLDSHHWNSHVQPGQERQELPGAPVGSLQGWDQDDWGGEAFAAGGHQDDLDEDHVGVDGVIHDLDEDQVGMVMSFMTKMKIKLALMVSSLMTTQVMREDEEVKAQLIQRIDNLTADNDLLKSEMDLVRNRISFKYDFVNEIIYNKAWKMKSKKILPERRWIWSQVLKSQQETRAKEGKNWSALQVFHHDNYF